MSKNYELYIEYIESEEISPGGECHGFMISPEYSEPELFFYYIDDSDGRPEWVRESSKGDIEVIAESEVCRDEDFPKNFKIDTARKSIDSYLLFNEFNIKAEKKGFYLKLDDYGFVSIVIGGCNYSHGFTTLEKLATHKHSSLVTQFNYVVRRLLK